MSIDRIISELRAIGARMYGVVTNRVDRLCDELVRRFEELENRDLMRREMIKTYVPILMKNEVGYKPKMGKVIGD